MKNCLNCKYEPLWPKPTGKEYPRQTAPCRWDGDMSVLPAHYTITKPHITMYADKSGLPGRCKAWVSNV